jgi:hypothetical protein
MKIKKSIDILAGAETIWPLIAEPLNIIKWCSTVKIIFQTGDKSEGLGAAFYFEEKAAGTLMKLHFVVTEWNYSRTVAFKMTSGNLVKGYEQKYTLHPTENGIKVTCFENVTLPFGILGKLAEILRRPVSEDHIERILFALKSLGEA